MALKTEDRVTQHLIAHLRELGPNTTADFCADVFGVRLDPRTITTEALGTRDVDLRAEIKQAVVIGLSDSRIASTRPDYRWAEGRADAVLSDGRTAILLEVKLPGAGNRLSRSQLIRHASHARLDLDWDAIDVNSPTMPAGIGLATWGAVDGWFERNGCWPNALGALRGPASTASVCADATPVARVPHPARYEGRCIAEIWDVRRVRELCSQRYGGELISRRGCKAETDRMVAAYCERDLTAKPGLRFASPTAGGMPPERVLSILYAGRGPSIRNACPATLAGFRDRTLLTGFDQNAFAALWAWATGASGQAADRVREYVPEVYLEAPANAPGLEHLAALIAPTRRTPAASNPLDRAKQ